jgi:plastocyanin/predicted small lipoprotein YifL
MRARSISLGALLTLALTACGAAGPEAIPPAAVEPTSIAAPPRVSVGDQDASGGTVRIARIVAADPGWIVIHTEQNGGPGPVVGYAAVPAGESDDVAVEIDPAAATPTLFAMLHVDAGTAGTYEFPGADVPVTGDQTNVPFAVTLPPLEPSVSVGDQPVVDGAVRVGRIVAASPGWIVIHSESNGGPGPVAGYAAVPQGVSQEVIVPVDPALLTPGLYAMLQVDAGTVGAYEFPGDDVPVVGENTDPRFTLAVAPGRSAEVEMEDFRFADPNLVVHGGTTVTWTNKDGTPHSSTSDDGLWDSGLFGAGESYSFTFETPGRYAYHCTAHGGPGGAGMAATVTVIP